jgi:phage terminase large subunit
VTILRLKVSDVFEKNRQAKSRIVVNQGGTSSGKTYSILQHLLIKAYEEPLHISICSVTLNHLKKGALKDFISILTQLGIYDEKIHNKTNHTFRLGHSSIEFFSLDQPGKARGPRRDMLYVNECNLIPYETFHQLLLRTRKQVYVDYNPADEYHWIYEKLLTREDITFIQSTFRDNPFLSAEVIKEIERLKETDPQLWRIYGKGERGTNHNTIYPDWELCNSIPDGCDMIYGLDFGYVNPSALVRIGIKERSIYCEEIYYQSYLTNAQRIEKAAELIPAHEMRQPIYCDSAEPQDIEEFYKAGFNAKPSNKDVEKGINKIKEYRVFIIRNSVNIQKEIKSYKWQEDKNGRILEQPVKFNDHALDAIRYAVHTHELKKSSGKYVIG